MEFFEGFEIEKCCCFTGPRPEKMNTDTKTIKTALKKEIKKLINKDYKYFMTGMSRGIDLIAGQCVVELSKKHDINLICAIPFLEQEKKWGTSDQIAYNDLLQEARSVICTSEIFDRGSYHKRNRFMIDNSSHVITYYNNSGGGTKYTIEYANKKLKPITNIFKKPSL